MPLKKGASKETFKKNVSEMVHSRHPIKQALAAAYEVQRKYQSKHTYKTPKSAKSHPGARSKKGK